MYCLFGYNHSTVIAHAGDGNFHVVILFDPKQEDQRREAETLNQFMVHTALSMEGKYSFSGQYKEYWYSFISFKNLLRHRGTRSRTLDLM